MPDNEREFYIKDDAGALATKVIDILKKTDKKVNQKNALEVLAMLDAEHGLTNDFSKEELDWFLDNFEDAIEDKLDKDEEVKDRTNGEGDSEK